MKVFFIGASKMGTTSIANALKEKGYRVTHTPHYGVSSHLREPDESLFPKFDYFLDGSLHNFHHLSTWFPDAKFVLLDREPDQWILSLFNWFSHIDERHMSDDKLIVRLNRLLMGKAVYASLLTDWLTYKKRALHYFKDDPRFIHVNIVDQPNDWARLEQHLGLQLDVKWDNQQQKKSHPGWITSIVARSEAKAALQSPDYPKISEGSVRDKLFLFTMRVLRKNFIRERHLMKNIKKAFDENGPVKLAAYRSVLSHIGKFAGVVACLALRIVVTRSRRLSPFIY